MIKLLSWNVNGIRAAEKKGFTDILNHSGADLFCVQETKAEPSQLSEEILKPEGYGSYWASAEKKGYSGVGVYTRMTPLEVRHLEGAAFKKEGRTLILDFQDFTLINGYFPNSQHEGKRLDYKLDFCEAVLAECETLTAAGRNVVVCGDYNIAHRAIDLARPKQNEQNPGYLPEERAWMDRFLDAGYRDTFRMFCDEPGHYSWWSYRMKAREKNIGWRLDYHCVNEGLAARVKSAKILPQIKGSDHCPVELILES